jgi:hypothetical protein
MPTIGITGLDWRRNVEDLVPGNMDTTMGWGSYNHVTSGDFLPGYVVAPAVSGNETVVARADSATVLNGRFRGIMFTEKSTKLDESLGGVPATVIKGPATLRVFNGSLKSGTTYNVGDYLKAGSSAVLATDVGKLVPCTAAEMNGDGTGDLHPDLVVGHIIKKDSASITFILREATA